MEFELNPSGRLPTKEGRQIHDLTHWPSEDWCECFVASRGKSHPHKRADCLKEGAKSEHPTISMDFCFTRGLEPSEEDREDIRLYGGDVRAGVTGNWTRSVTVLPAPGKGRAHVKILAEQVIRFIGACGYSSVIIKADGEPSTRLLLDVIEKARQKSGFKTVVELSGPEDSQANGRVERDIQTARGLARTLVRQVSERAGIQVRCSGSPTAYEMVTGRTYTGKVAMFGERVLARLPTTDGESV